MKLKKGENMNEWIWPNDMEERNLANSGRLPNNPNKYVPKGSQHN
jgi:hypothetical protein